MKGINKHSVVTIHPAHSFEIQAVNLLEQLRSNDHRYESIKKAVRGIVRDSYALGLRYGNQMAGGISTRSAVSTDPKVGQGRDIRGSRSPNEHG